MKILIACEESQVVCIEFRKLGHEAFSCDLQPCSGGHPEWHLQQDVIPLLKEQWDMMIAHPPCTYLSYVGMAWWNKEGRCKKRLEALDFFRLLWEAPIDKICIENPRGCASPVIAKYTQLIQPYYFGDEYSKTTCLWLKNLPLLKHIEKLDLFDTQTHVSKGEFIYRTTKDGKIKGAAKWFHDCYHLPLDERAKIRSKTFPGIARAMAEQWGNDKENN